MPAKDDFQICPRAGPPRLFKFVDRLDGNDVVAMLDDEPNVLTIDRGLYDFLTPAQKSYVQATGMAVLRTRHLPLI
jgi:hypothetical protein